MTGSSTIIEGKQISDDEIRKLFEDLDADGNGRVTLKELQQAQDSGKLGPVHSDVHQLLTAADTDGNSTIEIGEFFTFVRSQERMIASLFHEIDSQSNPDGHITVSDLKSYLEKDEHLKISDSEAEALIAVMDKNKDGTVEFSEMLEVTLMVAGGSKEVVRIWSCSGLPDQFDLCRQNMHPNTTSPMVTIIAGIMSGAITAAVINPLDILKTRLQIQRADTLQSPGIIGGLRQIVAQEGFRGLYKGLTPSLLALLPTWPVYFTSYDFLKANLDNRPTGSCEPEPATLHMAAAAGAGMTTLLVTNPLWVAKTRIQTQDLTSVKCHRKRYTTAFNALYRIGAEEGLRGLYSGLIPSLLGVVHVAIQFPLYERCKMMMLLAKSNERLEELNALDLVVASSFSKTIATAITYPQEVVTCQMQVAGTASLSSSIEAVKKVWVEDGIRGFYRGYLTNFCRTTPATALTFTSFELLSRALKRLD
ncbi:hypothetical protein CEUSTIGMA_g5285.t1 [Chlamydomonas eustigma]|uniref:EF-hand domain-containing protein n=1 Tax=Chlamydomonas eustigma TaxID=1157962 RepID=A0A250X439_9CHLO|nr:hypothetical protein CEUSTIGMA_g5285.t1 [Chlamydomonas eustigma]|eukprot:GAX77843.1 hypothetical protein CEUSTIGMA_g5285.t1 [Chlamydomonas eustigma]